MAEVDPTVALASLSSSLTTLEATLAPLLSTPFADHLAAPGADGQGLEPLVQARLEVLTGYVVHDLIWIYCKTAGVDPNTHPVLQELLRLKSYFDKLANAENGPAPPPAPSRPQLDKAAAGRFIKAAINSARPRTPADYTPTAGPSTEEERGKGRHTRFEADEEVQGDVERLLESEAESSSSEEEEVVVKEKVSKKEGKKAQSNRPKMDPFAGYDSPKPKSAKSKSKSTSTTSKPATPKPSKGSTSSGLSSGEKRKREEGADSPAAAGSEAGTPKGEKGERKKEKKLKMKKSK